MKKYISILLLMALMICSSIGLTACIYDDSSDLDSYDYNDNGEMETDEFQDAVNDYMDDNGF